MEPKLIEHRLWELGENGIRWSKIEPTGATNDLVGTAAENGTEGRFP